MARGNLTQPIGQGPSQGLSRRNCLALGLAGLAALACKPIVTSHGYIPTDEELALIEVGRDTRQTVQQTIGRPSTSGLLGDEAWYYVQSRWKSFAAAANVEIDRQVVAITFDETGHVANIERFGLEKGQIVPISRRVTTTNIRGRSVLAQIFGNIGRLNTGDMFK
jgi:outer membrane protein assembly factor BamE (lipoprotein component of BamABCDE complex)